MSGDTEWVREKWNRLGEWCKTRGRKKNAASESNETLVAPTTVSNGNENANLDAYAKGYQDGWKAGLANRPDSALTSNISSQPSKTSSPPARAATPDRSTETASPTPRQIEQRAMKAGWNKAWQTIKQEGWTKGCAHCSAHQRHENVLPRRRGATIGSETAAVPTIDRNVLPRRRGTTLGSQSFAVPYVGAYGSARPTWQPWNPPLTAANTSWSR
jgi:hypothetical protein